MADARRAFGQAGEDEALTAERDRVVEVWVNKKYPEW